MRSKKQDKAVSEIVGFIIIVSIVIIAGLVVFTVGEPMADSKINFDHAENSISTMNILTDEIVKVSEGEQNRTKVRMKIKSGASFSQHENNTTVQVRPSSGIPKKDFKIETAVYSINGKKMILPSTSIIRKEETSEDSVMIREPAWMVGTETLYLTLVSTTFEESYGTGVQQVEIVEKSREEYFYTNRNTVKVVSNSTSAWVDYFQKYENVSGSPIEGVTVSGNEVTADLGAEDNTIIINEVNVVFR